MVKHTTILSIVKSIVYVRGRESIQYPSYLDPGFLANVRNEMVK